MLVVNRSAVQVMAQLNQDEDSRESVYLSASQDTFSYPTLLVRAQGDPMVALRHE